LDRQYNGQAEKDKKTNNSRHNTAQKTKDLATHTPLQIVMNSGTPEK